MTRKAPTHAERKGPVSISFENPGIITSFGPLDATRLYAEDTDTERVPVVHARSFWGDVAKAAVRWAGDKAVEICRDAFRGYPRVAYARVGAGTTYGDLEIDPEKLPVYRAAIIGQYDVEPVDQTFLQRITGRIRQYVYGANHGGRLFVDKHLRGRSEGQYWATVFHEVAHTIKPDIVDEGEIEATGKAYAIHLARNDPSNYVRDKARQAYIGFLEADQTGVNGAIRLTGGRHYALAA